MLLCAKYIVPVSSEPMENGAILVRDGVIADIGKIEMMRLRYPDEEIKNFGMAALTPGFVDLHARVEDGVLRGLIMMLRLWNGAKISTICALAFQMLKHMILRI